MTPNHLLPDDGALKREADAQRERMPRHFFAKDDRDFKKRCQYRNLLTGMARCERPADHPVHLPAP